MRRINFLLGITYEVFRAVNRHSDLPWIEEFYRESYLKSFQSKIRKVMQTEVRIDISKNKMAGKDFNSFILA